MPVPTNVKNMQNSEWITVENVLKNAGDALKSAERCQALTHKKGPSFEGFFLQDSLK
jgi:hypothetical protein